MLPVPVILEFLWIMTIIPDANDSAQVRETDASRRPLEEKYYSLTPEEVAFFQSYTGIQDEEELKKHILKVQSDAYAVRPGVDADPSDGTELCALGVPVWVYSLFRIHQVRSPTRCTSYTDADDAGLSRLSISRLPAYKGLLQLGRERQGALFLDLGCCCKLLCTNDPICRPNSTSDELTYFRSVGNAVRKAVVDGFPAQQAIASDLHPGEFYQPNNPGVVGMMLTSFGCQNSGRWATSSLETTRKSSLQRSFQEIYSTRTSWQTVWGMPILPRTYHLYKASQA